MTTHKGPKMQVAIELTTNEFDALAGASGTLSALSITNPEYMMKARAMGIQDPVQLSRNLWDVVNKVLVSIGEPTQVFPGDALDIPKSVTHEGSNANN